jgi:hypothetical protein
VHGANMPNENDLPDEIRALSRRNALNLPDELWQTGITRLIEHIETLIQVPLPPANGSSSPEAQPTTG